MKAETFVNVYTEDIEIENTNGKAVFTICEGNMEPNNQSCVIFSIDFLREDRKDSTQYISLDITKKRALRLAAAMKVIAETLDD